MKFIVSCKNCRQKGIVEAKNFAGAEKKDCPICSGNGGLRPIKSVKSLLPPAEEIAKIFAGK